MNSIGVVNNTVITFEVVTDGNEPYHGDHFAMYKI